MPKYFFAIVTNSGRFDDYEGKELPGLEAARVVALQAAKEMTDDHFFGGDNGAEFEIRDQHGTVVMRLPFSDAANHEKR